MTYTYAKMPVSKSTYNEIKRKLKKANYDHAILKNGCLNMQGLALAVEEKSKPAKKGRDVAHK